MSRSSPTPTTPSAPAPAAKFVTYAATGGGTIDLPGARHHPARRLGRRQDAALRGQQQHATSTSRVPRRPDRRPRPAAGPAVVPVRARHPGDGQVRATWRRTLRPSLTTGQIVDIYKGTVTNWSADRRHRRASSSPGSRRAGSGTRSFFTAQLHGRQRRRRRRPRRRCRGGPGARPAPDPERPDAIAPFSQEPRRPSRHRPACLETGFSADRARLQRGPAGRPRQPRHPRRRSARTASSAPPRPRPLIEAAGFRQLYPPPKGGVCGAPTQSATSNFTTAIVTDHDHGDRDQRQCLLGPDRRHGHRLARPQRARSPSSRAATQLAAERAARLRSGPVRVQRPLRARTPTRPTSPRPPTRRSSPRRAPAPARSRRPRRRSRPPSRRRSSSARRPRAR